MADPKGPPLGDALGGRPAKKSSSKKAAASPSPAAAAGPSVAASPVPAVPRIPLAEPKPVSATTSDAKPRAAKKRTSLAPTESAESPPTFEAATAGPSSVAPDAAMAIAKHEADVERERQAAAARREAKKQRAKELEELKRRQELEQQARDARQRQQQAALNANAEECQEEPEERDEYDDDGFENYEDDAFEADDKPPPPATARATPSSTSSKAYAKSKAPPADDLSGRELAKIQQALQAESKGLQAASSRPPSSSEAGGRAAAQPSAEPPRKASVSSAIAGLKQSLDPRARRVKDVLEARKLEIDKCFLFQQPPVSEQDKLLQRLRRGAVRLAAAQTAEGARAQATQTKRPAASDKAMHFPDDIGVEAAGEATSDAAASSSSSSARFFRFLEHAAYACEVLVVESAMAAEQPVEDDEDDDDNPDDDRFVRRVELTKDTPVAGQRLCPMADVQLPQLCQAMSGRSLVALAFSPVASNLALAVYGRKARDNQQEAEPFAGKTLACVWDINRPARPAHVLQSEGDATAAALGPSRDLLVLAGAADGSVSVWDLRQTFGSAAGSSLDGMAATSPVYSTRGADYRAVEQHAAPVVAVEPIVRADWTSSSGSFQLGSMDDRGVLLVWSLVEFDAGDQALAADPCAEIGGRVKLVLNARIDTQQLAVPRQPHATKAAKAAKPQEVFGLVGPIASVVKFLPHDPNQFIVGTQSGALLRGHRFQDAAGGFRAFERTGSLAAVTALACHPFLPSYFLAGFDDGGISLFHCESPRRVAAWADAPVGVGVCSLAWSPARPAVFVAAFADASVRVWDLLEATAMPVLTHELDPIKPAPASDVVACPYPLALSADKVRTSRPAVAWADAGSPLGFAVHELAPALAVPARRELQATLAVLRSIV